MRFQGLAAIQQQLELHIYPGGKTALQLLSKGHYISMDMPAIELFAPPQTRVPKWFDSAYWDGSFNVYRPNLFSSKHNNTHAALEINNLEIKISTPEKLSIELCYLVLNKIYIFFS